MGKNAEKKYSEHLDTLTALVTNLALTRYQSRTPTILARELALDHEEVQYVLRNFKGLFRETYSKKGDEHYYWLQLRWARKDVEDANASDEVPELREPLDAAHLSALLNFILTMVEQEQASERQRIDKGATLTSAWIAAIVVVLGVFVNIGLKVVWP